MKKLQRLHLKTVKGGGNVCDEFTKKYQHVSCSEYFNIPPKYSHCVLVDVECFPE